MVSSRFWFITIERGAEKRMGVILLIYRSLLCRRGTKRLWILPFRRWNMDEKFYRSDRRWTQCTPVLRKSVVSRKVLRKAPSTKQCSVSFDLFTFWKERERKKKEENVWISKETIFYAKENLWMFEDKMGRLKRLLQ